MDFIFGTLATDALKLVDHRASRSGIQHGHRLSPADPLPGEAVTLTVYTGANFPADHVVCYYTLDGSWPTGALGSGQVVLFERVETVWDSLVWGYLTRWQAMLPAQPEGTVVRYRIGAWTDTEQEETFADFPEVKTTVEKAAHAFFNNQPLPENFTPGDPKRGAVFTFHVDRLAPPEWARRAIIYQIFVDRFYPGDGKTWLQTEDLLGICGGTLWGVIDKLDYLTALGINCIWLSPIFVSDSHHGYDATDYCRVEPRLGGDDALRQLVEAAHQRDIRVLLDLACNHVSNEHPIFKEAVSSPSSLYRDWFTFDDSPVGYRSFFGVATMPELNLDFPAARQWMIDIARYWLREFDVDGYRLDYANGPGPDFWADFWAACKAEKPDTFYFGEVIDAPDVVRRYSGRLDGCLDFYVGEALRKTYAWQSWSQAELANFLARHTAYFPNNFLMPTFIDNHDMDRFLYSANGRKDALKQAAAAQMRLPGPPIIYYGTEVGLSQTTTTKNGGLHLCRTPMLWAEQQDQDLLHYYQNLIQARVKGG